ncbi:hypothetical protein LX36DRAFT_178714 [Colletotrichum falcatum]|nr:hypothetical protein LX36DRAFT_178714 [Colletotrichum falcatum]
MCHIGYIHIASIAALCSFASPHYHFLLIPISIALGLHMPPFIENLHAYDLHHPFSGCFKFKSKLHKY